MLCLFLKSVYIISLNWDDPASRVRKRLFKPALNKPKKFASVGLKQGLASPIS